MKIHYKRIHLKKLLVLMSLPLCFAVILIVSAYSIISRSYVNGEAESKPHTAVVNKDDERKLQPAPINKKPTVVEPVRVVEKVFNGLDLEIGEKAVGVVDEEKKDASEHDSPCEELATSKTSGHATPPEKPRVEVHNEPPVKSAAKNADALATSKKEEDEDIKNLAQWAQDIGLTDAEKQKMMRSYQELCSVMPKKEAQKLIMWRIANSRKIKPADQ